MKKYPTKQLFYLLFTLLVMHIISFVLLSPLLEMLSSDIMTKGAFYTYALHYVNILMEAAALYIGYGAIIYFAASFGLNAAFSGALIAFAAYSIGCLGNYSAYTVIFTQGFGSINSQAMAASLPISIFSELVNCMLILTICLFTLPRPLIDNKYLAKIYDSPSPFHRAILLSALATFGVSVLVNVIERIAANAMAFDYIMLTEYIIFALLSLLGYFIMFLCARILEKQR